MGGGSWSNDTYASISTSYTKKSSDDVFANTKFNTIAADMDPMGIGLRESRDSKEHPNSLAIMVFLDETGSMGDIPNVIAREKLGHLMGTLVDNGVKDAQLMFCGIGDHLADKHPIQIGQFESDTTLIDKWLTSINLEGGGGGQNKESYLLAWLIAGRHTSIDCFEKRNKKGFLFTIGDEKSWETIEANFLREKLGYKTEEGINDKQVLLEAQRMYHVFHLHCVEGYAGSQKEVKDYWKDLLYERVIEIEDHTKISEVIAGIVAAMSGADIEDIVGNFDNETALMVKDKVSLFKSSSLELDNISSGVLTL